MARSYIRSRRGRKGGILVREAAVARGVPTNSLYSIPVTGSIAAAAEQAVYIVNAATANVLHVGSATVQRSTTKIVRASSVTVASKSPFLLKVMNASGGYTTYEIQGQKPTKITLSRDNSILGNPALLKAEFDSLSSLVTGAFPRNYVKISDNEDAVDIKLNLVVDSALDD